MKRLAQVAVFVISGTLVSAGITSPDMAEQAVRGWLNADSQPLDVPLQNTIDRVEAFQNEAAEPIYYIVYLQPAGFVVVSADDLIEPIIAFVEDGLYDPSPANPLGALVTGDLSGRTAAVRLPAPPDALGNIEAVSPSQSKWARLITQAERPEDTPPPGLGSISDVRRAPLVQSKWSQEKNALSYCYNTYTPNNYPCGCVATAMAQIMRYWRHPTSGIGRKPFTIKVNGATQTAYTRGGNGQGGPYDWDSMVLDPDFWTVGSQRNAIGAICYDAGLSVNMSYGSSVSSAYADSPKYALTDTFGYHAVVGINNWENIGPGLVEMINPNLDAKSPVLLSVSRTEGGHSIICDGYGYNASTPYHHLNMGWEGTDDAWYNLPNVNATQHQYTVVDACIYNIRPTGTGDGEVISGRVLYANGTPVPSTTVRAVSGDSCILATTDAKGIYAFSDLASYTSYEVTALVRGYVSSNPTVATGASWDNQSTSGNVWGVNLSLTKRTYWHVDDDAPADPTVPASFEDGSPEHPFNSIQEAIDIAANGDTIQVATGTYAEQVNFSGKAITLRSSDPSNPAVVAATVIDGGGTRYHVVQCVNHETTNTILEGFTITGGNANGSSPHDCGGGMLNTNSSPTVNQCIFTGNNAKTSGGGMENNGSNPTVYNCTFSGNTANNIGGGMYNEAGSNPTVVGCVFIGNTAGNQAGGMFIGPNGTVTDCIFAGNTGYAGGGLFNGGGSPAITNCLFRGNSATYGAGMWNYGSSPTVTNCIFNANVGYIGGGIYNEAGSNPRIINCTLRGNTADGGGIYNFKNSSPSVTNCILWGNSPNQIANLNSSVTVTYSDVEGGFAGDGNIDADPHFVGPAGAEPGAYNLRPMPDSPCIDAGDTTAVSVPLDAEGNPRVIDHPNAPNTGRSASGSAHVVDMGAYEMQCLGAEGDNNCDGRTDLNDLLILADNWLAGAKLENP